MASYQPKLFKIDNHLGIGIAGLASDGRLLRYGSPYKKRSLVDRALL